MLGNSLLQRSSGHPLHHQIGLSIQLSGVMDLDDVSMVQPPQNSRFAQHPVGLLD